MELVQHARSAQDTVRVTVAFFGLYGMSAPGPAYILETAAGGGQHSDPMPLRTFLDLFNNRLIGLFYRTWRNNRWPVLFARGGTDSMTRRVFSLCGLGSTAQAAADGKSRILAEHNRLAPIVPRTRLLRYLGGLSQHTRCGANLRGILWHYFDGPAPARGREFVEIEPFVSRWNHLDRERQCRIGVTFSRLGSVHSRDDDLVLGERVRDRMGQFRIVLGPLELEGFRKFLPSGSDYDALLAITNLYRPALLDYEMKLRLRADEVPSLRLGSKSLERLGWSTWVQTPTRRRCTEGVVRFVRPTRVHKHPTRARMQGSQ